MEDVENAENHILHFQHQCATDFPMDTVVGGPGMLAGCARGEAGVAMIRPESDSAAAGRPQIKE